MQMLSYKLGGPLRSWKSARSSNSPQRISTAMHYVHTGLRAAVHNPVVPSLEGAGALFAGSE